jgi:alpha-tubulin suppressor-like RCC1 family protein
VALRSDGAAVAWGYNLAGQINIPALPPGVNYAHVACGHGHTVALRSDGSVVAWGDNVAGQTNVPVLPPGLSYPQVAAGSAHSVALRSDGLLVAWGGNAFSQTVVPTLQPGISYAQVAAGTHHNVALVSVSTVPQLNAIGTGCTGSNGVTTLSSTQLPFIGNTAFSLDVSQAALNSQAYLFVANALAQAPIAVGGGCIIHLDAQGLVAFANAGLSPLGPQPTGPAGAASFLLPVPASPALAGYSIAFQAAVLDTTAPLALTLSNAVQCVLN